MILRVQIWRFCGPETPRSKFEGNKLWKGTCINQYTFFKPLSVQIGPKLRPVGWPRKRKNRKKRWGKKVTKPLYFSTTWRRHFQPICTKIGEFVDLTNVITPAIFRSKRFNGFFKPRCQKKHFHYKKQMAYITEAMCYRTGL